MSYKIKSASESYHGWNSDSVRWNKTFSAEICVVSIFKQVAEGENSGRFYQVAAKVRRGWKPFMNSEITGPALIL